MGSESKPGLEPGSIIYQLSGLGTSLQHYTGYYAQPLTKPYAGNNKCNSVSAINENRQRVIDAG